MAQEAGKANVVRCFNCFIRFPVPPKAKRVACPNCKVEYIVGWRGTQAKIMGLAV